ncbi:MAG: DUF1361 domain-containing protein [Candidatus Moraniibacteriota bacterium]
MLDEKSRKNSEIFLLVLLILSLSLLIARFFLSEKLTYLFLSWNLFLAVVPYGLARLVEYFHERYQQFSFRLWGSFFTWLLFFPNAPYIITDYIHLNRLSSADQLVFDLLLITSFSLTGLFFGLFSLSIVHSVIRERWGRVQGWLLVAGISFLSGYGVYLGRFARWNSWDILTNPNLLIADALGRLLNPFVHEDLLFTTFLFTGFVFGVYVLFRWIVRKIF